MKVVIPRGKVYYWISCPSLFIFIYRAHDVDKEHEDLDPHPQVTC